MNARTTKAERYECGDGHLCSIWPALIAAGASLAGGYLASKGSKDAAEEGSQAALQAAQVQAQAQRDALEFQKQIYGDQLALNQPYYGSGTNALAQLSSLYGLYQPENFSGAYPGTMQAGQAAGTGQATAQQVAAPQAAQPAYYVGADGTMYESQRDAYGAATDMRLDLAFDNPLYSSGRSPMARGQYEQVAHYGQPIGGTTAAPATQATAQPQVPQFDPTGMAGFYGGPEYGLAQNSLAVAMDRGTSALDRAAAASGGILSGAHAKAMSDYTQGTNQQYVQGAYDSYTNRLAALAGIGQTAGAQQAGYASDYGANAGNLMQGIGQTQAQGIGSASDARVGGMLGASNDWGNAFNNLAMLGGSGAFNGLGSLFGGTGSNWAEQSPAAWGTVPGSQQSQFLQSQW